MDDLELNADDEMARRVCSLGALFMSCTRPIASSQVSEQIYGLGPEDADTFNRSFHRDRERLTQCGLSIISRKKSGDEKLWEVDEKCSYASGAELDPIAALTLAIACQPLLGDDFPLAADLRIALAKIHDVFSGSTRGFDAEAAPQASPVAQVLSSCLTSGQAADITYEKASGEKTRKVVAPYGFFNIYGHSYFVAAQLDVDGNPIPDTTHTYRIDRVKKAAPSSKFCFEVPVDFCVSDYRKLPFQLGPTTCKAAFLVPEEVAADVRRATGTAGTITAEEDMGLVLHCDVFSVDDAASWAISAGVTPLCPEELVKTWKSQLEEVVRRG